MNTPTTGNNVILIGMPGVGKSTVGVLLAKTLHQDFIDTDVVIQSVENRSLQQIMQEDGREAFCQLEERYVLGLRPDATVIATGGSVVYSAPAMHHLASSGTIIHLDASLDVIRKRVNNTEDRGVVMMPGQTLESLYSERQPLYQQWADITVGTDDLGQEQVLHTLLQKMKTFGQRNR